MWDPEGGAGVHAHALPLEGGTAALRASSHGYFWDSAHKVWCTCSSNPELCTHQGGGEGGSGLAFVMFVQMTHHLHCKSDPPPCVGTHASNLPTGTGEGSGRPPLPPIMHTSADLRTGQPRGLQLTIVGSQGQNGGGLPFPLPPRHSHPSKKYLSTVQYLVLPPLDP